ncbi:hypothetical protein HPP92_027730 [Vanilla planifolia]|uniref:Uncharacterized protein n=1 Tax=Vanilla planifolia TaxID=51239 RepID=A0A835U4P1_VANPL|nr:hypothetical protein HPP92_027730 [Vanilla planifolia]
MAIYASLSIIGVCSNCERLFSGEVEFSTTVDVCFEDRKGMTGHGWLPGGSKVQAGCKLKLCIREKIGNKGALKSFICWKVLGGCEGNGL